LPFPVVIQIVDDGSPPPETARLRALLPLGDHGSCTVAPLLALTRNTQKGGAILAAWRAHPRAAWFAFVDADGAIPAAEVRRLLVTALAPGASDQAWLAVRPPDTARPLLRRFTSRIFSILAASVCSLPVADTQCGLKLISASAWTAIEPNFLESGFCFDVELLARLHRARISLVPFPLRWIDRPGGHVRLWRAAPTMVLALLRLRRRLPRA
jgi:dolichyl-phosphate beta-glucosyltransferase